ncbi:MAG: hypothetical protein AAF492_05980 [Verrucomicrobiota bacterium]
MQRIWLISPLLAGLLAMPAAMAQPAIPGFGPAPVKPVQNGKADPPPEPTKVLGIVQVGNVEEEMVERTRKFIEFNLGLVVKRLDSRKPQGGNLKQEGAALKDFITDDVAMVMGIVAADEKVKQVSALLHDEKVAVVNATVLQHENKETFGRRLERCVIRNYAFLMGLSTSPNPQSALFPYRTVKQLDAIGRNLDPPFLAQLQRDALNQGLTFVDFPALKLIDTKQMIPSIPNVTPKMPKKPETKKPGATHKKKTSPISPNKKKK